MESYLPFITGAVSEIGDEVFAEEALTGKLNAIGELEALSPNMGVRFVEKDVFQEAIDGKE